MDPNTHQPYTAARKLSPEESPGLIEKPEQEIAEKDSETNQLKEQLKQKDAEINSLKEALEREKEQREKQLGDKGEYNILALINALTSRTAAEGFDNLDEQPPTGIELVVRVYPHLKAETQIEFLSHLLMLCTSYQEYESQLDSLITHPSLEVRLLTLTRWFELLSSSIETNGFDVVIKNGGFTEAKIRATMLRAFTLIIELEHEPLQPLLKQLFTSIQALFFLDTPQFFTTDDAQALHELKDLMHESVTRVGWNHPHTDNLASVNILTDAILNDLMPSKLSPQGM
ncbi:hypothetical protein BLNAU_21083 [Blattamonas nauphoetae]|uniref:Uncharacterized protein n=1 Tax=Blattamonas nauphoetae TaxID=2049346 RepID=A0ABQ9WWX1_9EUKA|nr:hypothetical protein BLNAU_21083 [Blattamonas nauphoetae]